MVFVTLIWHVAVVLVLVLGLYEAIKLVFWVADCAGDKYTRVQAEKNYQSLREIRYTDVRIRR